MVQIILSIITLVVLVGFTVFLYKKRTNERTVEGLRKTRNLDTLGELVSKELSEYVRDDDVSDAVEGRQYAAIVNKKKIVARALDECIYGVERSVTTVLGQIKTILERELPTIEDCYEIVDFREVDFLHPNEQWEILIYFAKKSHRTDVMHYLNKTYHLTDEVNVVNEVTGELQKRRLVDHQALNAILMKELDDRTIEYNEMLDIISILVYNRRYGFGVVNTLRALDIDGFNFGTSGSIRYIIDGDYECVYRTTNSVWVQMDAKWVHFSFLDFGKEAEMKRVINQLVAWGTTSPMTEKHPYKVNDAYDGARITAVRPPAGECWACCIRKFSSGLYVKEKLLNKPRISNWELPSTLMYYLMRGEQTTAFTGQQNTGKTSMMKAAMADVAMVNIRILEMSFELAIRELYPWKNVITVKPTDYVTSSQIQDLLKKTDGYLSMVGEVAEDIVAARMIQFCLIASAFTIFSHHGRDDYSLINGLANSLVACGEYENHDVAISTVLDAIKNNVHLDFMKGERVVAYISEIIKLDEIAPYPEITPSSTIAEAIDQMTRLQREYYTRRTDRVRFKSRKIIIFNPDTMSYEANEGYSPEALRRILSKLQGEDRTNFIAWYKKHWAHVLTPATQVA